jgi:hypothetical protein
LDVASHVASSSNNFSLCSCSTSIYTLANEAHTQQPLAPSLISARATSCAHRGLILRFAPTARLSKFEGYKKTRFSPNFKLQGKTS